MGVVTKENAEGSLNELNKQVSEDIKYTINTIQRTALVRRMCLPFATTHRDILHYDNDNLYPNKIKAIAERSGSTNTGINTLSSFISGNGFTDIALNDLVINSDNETTLFDILRNCSDEKARFSGIPLHFNYNALGQIVEINEIAFETLRYTKDLKYLIYSYDWSSRRKYRDTEIKYNIFNPSTVIDEIKDQGIDNYKGQVLYWVPRKADIYPLCRFDSVLDDAQFEAESKIYKVSNIQNDYSIGGFIKIPSNLETRQEIIDLKQSIKKGKGSENAGKVQPIPMPSTDISNSRLFEPMSRNNIDGLFKTQNEEARFNIYAAFQQPPILNGISKDGMFNQDQFVDAFDYYNSFTETDRKELEKLLTKILSFSIWSNVGKVEIAPKSYIKKKEVETKTTGSEQTQTNNEEV